MADDKFPEEGEVVLCTVREIHGTTVFADLDKYQKTGVINTSEIAPGRIRNIRDYVVPQKKVVCIVLRIDKAKGHIDLSLRRVTKSQTQEELQKHKKEKEAFTILNIILKDKSQEVAENILKKHPSIYGLLEMSKEDPSALTEFMGKEEAAKVSKIVAEKIKTKSITAKADIKITTSSPEGVIDIKNALDLKDVRVSYLGAPSYTVISEDKDPKLANKKLEAALLKITESLRKSGAKVEISKE